MCTAHLDATNMCNATCSPTACIAHCKFGAEGILRLFLQPSLGHWDARDGCLLHCTSLSAESIREGWEELHWLRMWCVSCLVWGHMTSNKCPCKWPATHAQDTQLLWTKAHVILVRNLYSAYCPTWGCTHHSPSLSPVMAPAFLCML